MEMSTLLLVLHATAITADIIDYSHSSYIPISDGETVLWETYGYLKHVINITEYSTLYEESYKYLHILRTSHMPKLLEADFNHIQNLLQTISVHHRQSRSINFLGTALKVIAGTPDFDDFQQTTIKIEQLIDANKQQVQINSQIQEQINNITDVVNKIIKDTKEEEIDTGHLFEMLLARNRAVIIQLDNIILSVTLAKIGLLNPLMLDHYEIKSLIENEQLTNTTIADLMLVSKFKVLQNNDVIIFLIKYPRPKLVCKQLLVFPVAHNNTMLYLEENSVASCGKQSYSVNDCVGATRQFCELSPKTSCAQQLTSGSKAQCRTTFNHLPPVNEVSDGIVIINDQPAIVIIANNTTNLVKGTYVVTFQGRILINGSEYFNRNSLPTRIAEAPLNVKINFTGYREMLSLPYLQHHSIQNRQLINSLYSEVETRSTITISSLVVVTLVGVSVYIIFCKLKQKKRNHSARDPRTVPI